MIRFVVAAALGAAALLACTPPSSRPCANPGGRPVTSTEVSSPALECPSRICLLQPPNGASSAVTPAADAGGFRATCTQLCQHDSDCDDETRDYCAAGSVCAVVTDTGPFACKKLCVCSNDRVQGFNVDADGGTTTPASCSTATRERR